MQNNNYQEITQERPSSFDQAKWKGSYLPWGKDNRYPNRITSLIQESYTGKTSSRKLNFFFQGSGFDSEKDLVGNANLGRVWSRACGSTSILSTFALHVNYNLQYKISSISYIDVSNCRYKIPEEPDEFLISKIGLSDAWGKSSFRDPKNVVDLDIYNADPKAVREQIKRDGIQNYKGQVYIYSEFGESEYCNSVYHPSRESVETEVEIKLFDNSKVRNGFKPSQVFVRTAPYSDETEKQAWKQGIKDNVGGGNAGKVFSMQVNGKEEIPVVIPLTKMNYDKEYEITKESAKEDIRISCYGIPPILLGWKGKDRLSPNSDELIEACNYFSAETFPDQEKYRQSINEILENSIFSSRIENIKPFKLVQDDTNNSRINPDSDPE